MSCLGVHFALTAPDVDALRAIADESERLEHLEDEIEERYFASAREFLAESGKSWDALHRALSDGHLTWTGGTPPLNQVVLAGELLYTGTDYVMSLKSPAQVAAIAAALAPITRAELRRRYDAIDARDYGFPLCDEDFEATWEGFEAVRALYARAAAAGRHVLFTADQ